MYIHSLYLMLVVNCTVIKHKMLYICILANFIIPFQAIFETPCFPSGSGCILSFAYHLYTTYVDQHNPSLFDMGVLEVDVWHDGVWNQVFREGGRNYNNTWHASTIDLSVSGTTHLYINDIHTNNLAYNLSLSCRVSVME